MAKFNKGNLKLKTNQKILLGDSLDSQLTFNGSTLTVEVSGTTLTIGTSGDIQLNPVDKVSINVNDTDAGVIEEFTQRIGQSAGVNLSLNTTSSLWGLYVNGEHYINQDTDAFYTTVAGEEVINVTVDTGRFGPQSGASLHLNTTETSWLLYANGESYMGENSENLFVSHAGVEIINANSDTQRLGPATGARLNLETTSAFWKLYADANNYTQQDGAGAPFFVIENSVNVLNLTDTAQRIGISGNTHLLLNTDGAAEIYHAGSKVAETTANGFTVTTSGGTNVAVFDDVSAELYYAGNKTLDTVAGGLSITDGLSVAQFYQSSGVLYCDNDQATGNILFRATNGAAAKHTYLSVHATNSTASLWAGGTSVLTTINDGSNYGVQITAGGSLGGSIVTNPATDVLWLRNHELGAAVSISSRNVGDTADNLLFNADPDGAVRLYHAGAQTLFTKAGGFYFQNGIDQGYISLSTDIYYHNHVHGGRHLLKAEQTDGTNVFTAVLDPDGAAELYYAGSKVAETTANGFTVTTSGGTNVAVFDDVSAELYYAGVKKFETTAGGFNFGDGTTEMQVSYTGTGVLFHNQGVGGSVDIMGKNLASANRYIMIADPDTDTTIYGGGVAILKVTSSSARIYDASVSGYIEISHDATNGKIRQIVDGGTITLSADNTATSTETTLFVGDPDGAADLYYAGTAVLSTTASGVSIGDGSSFGSASYSGVTFILKNDTASGYFGIHGTNSSSQARIFLNMNPNGEVQIYTPSSNTICFTGLAQGAQIGGSYGNMTLEFASAGVAQWKNQEDGGTMQIIGQVATNVDKTIFKGDPAGAAELYYDGSKKFETTSTGVSITGELSIASAGMYIGNTHLYETTATVSGAVLSIDDHLEVDNYMAIGNDAYINLAQTSDRGTVFNLDHLFPASVSTSSVAMRLAIDSQAATSQGLGISVKNTLNTSQNSMYGAFISTNASVVSAALTDIVGITNGVVSNSDNSTTTNVIGIDTATQTGFGMANSTITNMIGEQIQLLKWGSGDVSITDAYGILVKTPGYNPSGTTDNLYGLYIEDQSTVGFTTDYNIYSAGANSLNYLEGRLDVGGDIHLTGSLYTSGASIYTSTIHPLTTSASAIEIADGGAVDLYYNNINVVSTISDGNGEGIVVKEADGDATHVTTIQQNAGDCYIWNKTWNGVTYIRGYDAGGNPEHIGVFKNAGTTFYDSGAAAIVTQQGGLWLKGATQSASLLCNDGVGITVRAAEAGAGIYLQGYKTGVGNTNMTVLDPDGSVDLYYAGSKVAETTANGFTVTTSGGTNVAVFSDDGCDLYHDGTKTFGTYINGNYHGISVLGSGGTNSGRVVVDDGDASTWFGADNGYLRLKVYDSAWKDALVAIPGGSTSLYTSGAKVLETTSAGISITDGTATAATIGFNGEHFEIKGNDPSGNVRLISRNAGDTLDNTILDGNPDGSTDIYNAGTQVFGTAATGIEILSSGNSNNFILNESGNMVLSNTNHGYQIKLRAENLAAGTATDMLIADPDGSVDLYNAGSKSFGTVSNGVQIFDPTDNANYLHIRVLAGSINFFNDTQASTIGFTGEATGGGNIPMAVLDPDGAADLYYAGVKTLATSPGGIDIWSVDQTAYGRMNHDATHLYIWNYENSGHIILQADNAADAKTNTAVFDPDGPVELYYDGNLTTQTTSAGLQVNSVFSILERSSDPAQPVEGETIIWMSDGTGKGNDGDVLIAGTAGGTTTYSTLFVHASGGAW